MHASRLRAWLALTTAHALLALHATSCMSINTAASRPYHLPSFLAAPPQALSRNLIPVVRGGISREDYQFALPPGSFIDTRDFAHPADLAAHLHRVACNFTLYKQYHAWRRQYKLMYDNPVMLGAKEEQRAMMCKYCEFLNNVDPKVNKRFADLPALVS